MPNIHYTISIEDPIAHIFKVTLTADFIAKGQIFRLPTWIPGSYMIRDFARNIVSLNVNQKKDKVVKIDSHSWQVKEDLNAPVIEYLVYAWDLSVRGAHLDDQHAFFNGTSLFLEPVGMLVDQFIVEFQKPRENYAKDWQLATSMPRLDEQVNYEFGRFYSRSYDELLDHPFEAGKLDIAEFEVAGVPHALVVVGEHQGDLPRIVQDLERICKHQVEFFSELPSCVERYLFLVNVLPSGYGGLEHRSSTALHCSYSELPKQFHEMSDDYINFLTLCSHEYFHTWNIKQIKPSVFLPYDLTREVHTDQLWIFEGFTSYYEDRLVYEAGVIDQKQYLKLLAQAITRVHRGRGRHLQSVAESSFDAWTRFYKQDESAPNVIVSYYTKGKLIALCLDLLIRQTSQDKLSLNDIMIELWRNYGIISKGLASGELEAIFKQRFGSKFLDFFNRFVYSTDELPLQELLALVGVKVQWNNSSSLKTLSGDDDVQVSLGATLKQTSDGVEVVTVLYGSNAYELGLCSGDKVVALNEYSVDIASLEKRFAWLSPGEQVSMHIFRRGKLLHYCSTVKASEKLTCDLRVDESLEIEVQWW
ncbi:M61 family metallopeptidase [Pleionea litopenaei]|uniref:PDZ domain-containing protein n=1 Tax=Pleionea litopenaei TaxID=3070815 RepID=A0AA51RUU1_9GAMM|nr:PDZ domain-containing protein [Pleionea sp. HL-JVS1]WMS88068.1 PDZ domain-containing protein [Pleionea sp. HL-JVS1]